MKKNILFLSILNMFLMLQAAAQLNTEAKLKFQQAQQAYENGTYFTAANTAYKAYEMNNNTWTAALRHLYLKSACLSYKNPGTGGGAYDVTYKNFTLFADYCNIFLAATNKNTFPPDKYQDIVEAEQYFQQMRKKYEYQKDRTPEKAVAFLNECLKKFGKNISVENATRSRYYDQLLQKVAAFQLDSPYLKLVLTAVVKNDFGKGRKSYTRNETYYQVDLLNFSRATGFDYDGYGSKIEGQTAYQQDGKKIMLHFFRRNDVIETHVYDDPSRQPAETTAKNEAAAERIKRDTTGFPPQFVAGYPTTSGLDIFYYFNNSSQEFNDGNYADRIKDAFQFLIDYYPKRKEETVEEKKNGF